MISMLFICMSVSVLLVFSYRNSLSSSRVAFLFKVSISLSRICALASFSLLIFTVGWLLSTAGAGTRPFYSCSRCACKSMASRFFPSSTGVCFRWAVAFLTERWMSLGRFFSSFLRISEISLTSVLSS